MKVAAVTLPSCTKTASGLPILAVGGSRSFAETASRTGRSGPTRRQGALIATSTGRTRITCSAHSVNEVEFGEKHECGVVLAVDRGHLQARRIYRNDRDRRGIGEHRRQFSSRLR